MAADVFFRCVENQEVQSLVKLPGIGKKTAERLIVELKDRLPREGGAANLSQGQAAEVASSPEEDALAALIALGFKPQDAQSLLRPVVREGLSSEDLIREALRSVSR
jgi:Holliday junction DNA helicase RuvA